MAPRGDEMPGLFYNLESTLTTWYQNNHVKLGSVQPLRLPSSQSAVKQSTTYTIARAFQEIALPFRRLHINSAAAPAPSLDLPYPLFRPLWRPPFFLCLSPAASSLDLRHGRPRFLLGFSCSSAPAFFLFLSWANQLFDLMDSITRQAVIRMPRISNVFFATSDLP